MENYTNALPVGSRLKGNAMLYEITEVLGQGGFGITYKAELLIEGSFGMTRSRAFFAIKEFFISDINQRDGDTVTGTESRKFSDTLRKFERESKLLSTLNHPGICHVQDAFRANGTAYYVMDFYPGGSMLSLISHAPGGALSEAMALGYIHEIGLALAYLHREGMAHLDLKPQNIMLKADGHPVLIDFGISKQFDDDGQFRSSDTMGGCTPGYAPLEQANYTKGDGDPHLMDIYALGATLYKMLTGQTPPKAPEVLNNGLPTDLLRRKGVSDRTIAAIVRAMQPIKRDRYQSVEEMLKALPAGQTPDDEEVAVIDVKPEPPRTKQTPQPNQANPKNRPIDPISQNSPISQKIPRTAIIIAIIVALGIIGYILLPKGHDNQPEPIIENIAQADTTSAPTPEPATPESALIASDLSDSSDPSDRSDQSDLAEQRQREEEARKQREEQERLDAERRQREEQERLDAERRQREEQERLAAEQRQREEEARKQREDEQKRQAELNKTYGHATPKNFELCTRRGGKVFYFSESEWKAVPSSVKSQYSKKGIYVSGGRKSFLVALHDSGKLMTWNEAMSQYGNSLPSKEEADIMTNNTQAICKAIIAFGGDKNPRGWYWTRTEKDFSSVWLLGLKVGGVNYGKKTYTYHVLTVSPVPASR